MSEPALAERPRVRRCGNFLLGRRVGAGGMAAVFAARQEGLEGAGRLVAIKIMATFLADDPDSKRMFLREATIATRLEHPNVVRVYDVGNAEGELYLAMELVHGAPLSAVVRALGDPLPLPIAIRVVAEVARGLHAAHEARTPEGELLGLVHQDVSPQNVMLGYDGSVKLLDFGVARLASVDGSRTITVRGKPSYLAPEQMRAGRIDRRTDVFALGIVLHELLTGERLFGGDIIADAYAALIGGEPVADVRQKRPEVPAPLAEVVARALRRDADDRFASVDEFRRALAEAAAAAGVHAIDPDELGAWLRVSVPPSWTPAQLEREIVTGAPAAGVPDVSELPTQAPEIAAERAALTAEPPSVAMPQAPPEPRARSRRWLGIVFGLVALVGVAGSVYLIQRDRSEPSSPFPSRVAESSSTPREVSAPPPVLASSDTEPVAPSASAAPIARLPRSAPGPARSSAPSSASPAGPAPAATAAEVTTGTIAVWSNVSGRVRIDGASHGESPLPGVSVAPGTHTVSVSSNGSDQSKTVTVKPGEHVKVRFVF